MNKTILLSLGLFAARPAHAQSLPNQAKAANRAQLPAFDHREPAARNQLGLERAAADPDGTVGLSTARDALGDAREKFVGLCVSAPLPLSRRNAAGIDKASADLTQQDQVAASPSETRHSRLTPLGADFCKPFLPSFQAIAIRG